MEKNIYLLYDCDQWRSTASSLIIGVFTNKKLLLKAIRNRIQTGIAALNINEKNFIEEFNKNVMCVNTYIENTYIKIVPLNKCN